MMVSRSWPSAIIFRIDAGSGRWIGSFLPANGLNVRYKPIGTACCARFTMGMFDSQSKTATAPSLIYPSVPPVMIGSNLTSASLAAPNGISLLMCSGSGRSVIYVDGSDSVPSRYRKVNRLPGRIQTLMWCRIWLVQVMIRKGAL